MLIKDEVTLELWHEVGKFTWGGTADNHRAFPHTFPAMSIFFL